MYNVIKYSACVTAFAGIAMFASCSADNKRAEEANEIINQVEQFRATKDYASALQALDSLDTSYRDCLDARRQGTRLRLETLIVLTQDSIDADEARRQTLMPETDSLKSMMLRVSMPGTEGYWVAKSIHTGSETASNMIQPRVDEDGYFFIVASTTRHIDLKSIECGTVSIPCSSIKVASSDMASVRQEDCSALAQAVMAAQGTSVKVVLNGTKGKITVTLNAKQIAAWRTTWQYSQALQLATTSDIRREKYERQLATLQDQLASLNDTIKIDE